METAQVTNLRYRRQYLELVRYVGGRIRFVESVKVCVCVCA